MISLMCTTSRRSLRYSRSISKLMSYAMPSTRPMMKPDTTPFMIDAVAIEQRQEVAHQICELHADFNLGPPPDLLDMSLSELQTTRSQVMMRVQSMASMTSLAPRNLRIRPNLAPPGSAVSVP